jgi:hypothetical protein
MIVPLGFIYGLQHPVTGEIFYVGATQVSLKNRLRTHYQHLKEYQRGKRTINNRYVYLELLLPKKAEICLLELVINNDLDKREVHYIKKYRKSNPKLTNMTDGGKGMCTSKYYTEQQKTQYGIKISTANKDKSKPIGFKEHLSKIRKGVSNPAARKLPHGGIVCFSGNTPIKLFTYGFEINDFMGTKNAYSNTLRVMNSPIHTAYKYTWKRLLECSKEIQDIVHTLCENTE